MKYALTILAVVLFLGQSNSQTILNGDFESWYDSPQFESTMEWDNSNLEYGFAEVTLEITDGDAFDGTHAVYLETKEWDGVGLMGFTLLGVFEESPESGFPYEGTIDGMSANVQYDVQEGDSANAIVIAFYEGNVVDMSVAKITGSQASWVELNVELSGSTLVDQVAVAFASSNAMSEDEDVQFIPGSWIKVDNVQLTLNETDMDVVPNGSFEEWEVITLEVPEEWNANVNPELDLITKTTDAYEGNYAIKLQNFMVPDDQEVAQAVLTNGIFENDEPVDGQSINSRPESFIGYYKYGNTNGDVAYISAQFLLNEEVIGLAVIECDPASEYQQFNQAVQYVDEGIPDAVVISATAGEEVGSALYLDNLSFDFVAGIQNELDNSDIELSVYPNPFSDMVNFNLDSDNVNVQSLSMFDVTGKMILDFDPSFLMLNREIASVDLSSLNNGIYTIVLRTDNNVITETVIKK